MKIKYVLYWQDKKELSDMFKFWKEKYLREKQEKRASAVVLRVL
jgi:hypothetical protein